MAVIIPFRKKTAIERAQAGETINVLDLIKEVKAEAKPAPVPEKQKEIKTLADYLPDPQYNFKSGHMYSGENLWVLDESQKANSFKSDMWLGFYQARELGGHVIKGSKGTCIKVYKEYTKKDADDAGKTEKRQYFKNEYVFNLDQIEFKTEPTPPEKETSTTEIKPRTKKEKTAPTVAPVSSETSKEILQFTNKLKRSIPSFEKFINVEREKLATKATHTRRMKAQYDSKLFEVNVKEFYLNLYTNLLNREIIEEDLINYKIMETYSSDLISIRFNSERYYEYTDGKPYRVPHQANAKIKKEIETAYQWIESNLKIDPAKIKADKLANIERTIKNLHGVIEGFHSTPSELGDKIINKIDILHGYKILEPSAGCGALADKAREYIEKYNIKNTQIDVCERHYELREVLKLKDYNVISHDFMDVNPTPQYNLIIMNPPFEKGQDIAHIQHAFKMLKSGGQLISIMANGNMTKQQKKYLEFQEFVNANNGYTEKIDAGAFKESRTMVSTMFVKIEKK